MDYFNWKRNNNDDYMLLPLNNDNKKNIHSRERINKGKRSADNYDIENEDDIPLYDLK